MAARPPARRRRATLDDELITTDPKRPRLTLDASDDDEDSEHDEPTTTNPRRPHLSLSDSDDDDGSADDESVKSESQSVRSRLSQAPALDADEDDSWGPNAFQAGAVVRVVLDNFVTYEHAEFYPGPSLNMVIGPNGTGKSSLVCALCLGLGYSPNILGRAGKISEYVKMGKAKATVEIELKGRGRSRNPIIKLQITREDNSKKWWLDGRECKHKDIEAAVRKQKIQVDNLCQFLPQDRVPEFSGLTPVQLLGETLRAAAPAEMIEWQGRLKTLTTEHKALSEKLHTVGANIINLENRQQANQADVDRLRERLEIEQVIDDLKKARKFAEYQQAVDEHRQAKKEHQMAQLSLKKLQSELGPSLQAVTRKEEYRHRLVRALAGKRDVLKAAGRQADNDAAAVEAADGEAASIRDLQRMEEERLKTLKQDIQKARSKITMLEAEMKKPKIHFVPSEWNTKIRAEEHRAREVASERDDIKSQIQSINSRGVKLNVDIDTTKKELEALDSKQGQKLNLLRRQFPEVASGWQWVQEHQDEFEKEVFGPPMLTCSVKDEAYADLIESLLQKNDFLCFVAQTKQDHLKLHHGLLKELKLAVTIRTSDSTLANHRPPATKEEASRLGLDGFAIDFLDGPEPVLANFCLLSRLHMTGVSLRKLSEEQSITLSSHPAISSWATGKQINRTVRRQEYGSEAASTVTRPIRESRFWKDQAVDPQEKASLDERYLKLREQWTSLSEQRKELKEKLKGLDDQDNEIAEKLEELKSQKGELQRESTRYAGLPSKLETENTAFKNKLDEVDEVKQKQRDFKDRADQALLDKARHILRYVEAVNRMRSAHEDALDGKLQLIEAESDVSSLKEKNTNVSRQLEQEKENLAARQRAFDVAKAFARRMQSQAHKLNEGLSSEEAGRLREMVLGKSAEQVDNEVRAEEAKLELIHATNPNVLREFEKRKTTIERERRQLEEGTANVERIAAELEDLRSRWEPRLDALVAEVDAAFSRNFEAISCKGGVVVQKAEDFADWAIEILVSFRPDEEPQKLDRQRQSGGERSVATIFYLLSLQGLAQAPFRVVDEINQGMDPRNERIVHERMVEIACREHTSQYFLITPKLLPALRYDSRMRVLCIMSGPKVAKTLSRTNAADIVSTLKRLEIRARDAIVIRGKTLKRSEVAMR